MHLVFFVRIEIIPAVKTTTNIMAPVGNCNIVAFNPLKQKPFIRAEAKFKDPH